MINFRLAKLNSALTSFAVLILCTQPALFGQSTQPPPQSGLPFLPGHIALYVGPRISDFAPTSDDAACKMLEQLDYKDARAAFQIDTQHDPADLAAWAGLIQSSQSEWNAMFQEYYQAEKLSHSLRNEFRLGLVADYLVGSHGYDARESHETYDELCDIALRCLRTSFENGRVPIAGFALAEGDGFLGFLPGDTDAMERMIPYVAGSVAFAAYIQAKASNWHAATPVVKGNIRSLQLLRWIVGDLWVTNSIRTGRTVISGDKRVGVWDNYSQNQLLARTWLSTWENEVKAQITAEGGHVE